MRATPPRNEHNACSAGYPMAEGDMACNTLPYKIAALRDAHHIPLEDRMLLDGCEFIAAHHH